MSDKEGGVMKNERNPTNSDDPNGGLSPSAHTESYWTSQHRLSKVAFYTLLISGVSLASVAIGIYLCVFWMAMFGDSSKVSSIDWHVLYLPPAGILFASVALLGIATKTYKLKNPSEPLAHRSPPSDANFSFLTKPLEGLSKEISSIRQSVDEITKINKG